MQPVWHTPVGAEILHRCQSHALGFPSPPSSRPQKFTRPNNAAQGERIPMKIQAILIALVSLASTVCARAYVAPVPAVVIVASPDGYALLRIDPGIGAPGTWHSQPGVSPRPAQATVFRFDPASKTYRTMTTFTLRNPVAPKTAVISDGAEFIVTCDDWDPEIGCTSNVVVVYRGSGELVKAWALDDIYSPAEIKRFGHVPSNVPLRRWRGERVSFITDSKGPSVWIQNGRDLPWHVDLRLDLTSLTFEKYPEREMDR